MVLYKINNLKTIKSYMTKLNKLADINTKNLKGYEKLTQKEKEALHFLEGELNNFKDLEI